MFKTCKHCEIEFDLYSRQKKLAGGYINECPDCVDDRGGDSSEPKHFGVTGSLGEDVSVIRFEDQADRDQFKKEYGEIKTLKDFF
tara:strand:+ start:632 stop:886 length:255 start_codon:yes stop_codon:yes gene_type:complete